MGKRYGATCHRCDSLMITPAYDDDPMYCIMCGAQGDMPVPPPRINHNGYDGLTDFTNNHPATIYVARYGGDSLAPTMKERTIRYRMTHGLKNSTYPSLAIECPWCGDVSIGHTWAQGYAGRFSPTVHGSKRRRLGDERIMYMECTKQHHFTMVCAKGNYFWR